MKLALAFVLLVLLAAPLAFADIDSGTEAGGVSSEAPETQTLFSNGPSGFHAGIEARSTTFQDAGASTNAMMLGLRAAWTPSPEVALGVGLHKMFNAMVTASGQGIDQLNYDADVGMVYGGLYAQYSYQPWRLIHPSIGLLVGAGNSTLDRKFTSESASMAFTVFEPQLSGTVNVSSNLRAGMNLAYRWARTVRDNEYLSNSKLSGLAVGLFMEAGWF